MSKATEKALDLISGMDLDELETVRDEVDILIDARRSDQRREDDSRAEEA